MKAMLLAAGRGERMRPLTDKTPKPLLKVGDKCLIEYHLQALAKHGFEDIVINISHLREQFPQALGDGDRYGVRIYYSDEGDQALDTGGGIYQALDLLGDDPFLVVNSDIRTDYPLEKKLLKENDLAHLVLVDNPLHNAKGDFLLVNGRAANNGTSMLTFGGIAYYRPDLFKTCHPGRFSVVPLLRQACTQGLVSAEHYQGQWLDIGTPERLQTIEQNLQSTGTQCLE